VALIRLAVFEIKYRRDFVRAGAGEWSDLSMNEREEICWAIHDYFDDPRTG
jgi:hypothetical protein